MILSLWLFVEFVFLRNKRDHDSAAKVQLQFKSQRLIFSRSIINIYVLTSVQLVHHLWIWKETRGTEKGRRKLISRYHRERNKRAAETWTLCDDAACEHRLLWIVVAQSRVLVGSCDTVIAVSCLAAPRVQALWHLFQEGKLILEESARVTFWSFEKGFLATASKDVAEIHYR